MKALKKCRNAFVIGAISAIALFTGCENGGDPVSGNPVMKPSNVSTAQSIGVAMNQLQTDVVIESVTQSKWTYDRDCAQEHFVVTATVGNVEPATLNAAFQKAINDNKCIFWNGGALMPITKAEGGGKNFKSVTISPKPGMAVVAPKTCWGGEEIADGSTDVDVTVQADIAGESVVVRSSGPYTKKFSFSLLDTAGYTRVVGVTYYLDKWNGTSWDEVASNAVGDVTDVEQGMFSHFYVANGGTFGSAPALGALMSSYTQGEIMSNTGGISGDDFAGNNSNVLGAGTNAMVAHGPAWTNTLSEAGTYRIRVAGSVKENAGVAAQSFTVTSNVINISTGAPNCD